jgi:hypothetical protein
MAPKQDEVGQASHGWITLGCDSGPDRQMARLHAASCESAGPLATVGSHVPPVRGHNGYSTR